MTIAGLGVNTSSLAPGPPAGWLEVQVTPGQVEVMAASPRYSMTSPWSVQGNPLPALQSRSKRTRFTVSLNGETEIGPAPSSRRIRVLPRTASPGTRKGKKQVSPPEQSPSEKQVW